MKKIKIHNNKKECYATIDDEDYDSIRQYRWVLSRGYAIYSGCEGGKKFTISMHRLIMNPKKHEQIDHINRDRLDNRKSNLRICTHAQNCQNTSRRGGRSGYRGVRKDWNRYEAIIVAHGIKYALGRFDTAREAAEAYNEAAIKYHGEFAVLNKI